MEFPTCQLFELIVVDDNSTDATAEVAKQFGSRVISTNERSGPAAARNLGGRIAQGEFLVFLDADVSAHPTTISRLVNVLLEESDVAAVFGSYDVSPTAGNLISQFRNLLHHHVHQAANPNASSFWAGCGAIRRSVFVDLGGFDARFQNPSIEDIELGIRLRQAGYKIRLDSQTQVTHAKPWSLVSMLSCDVWSRGVPWTRLILRQKSFPNDLNLKHAHRFSVVFAGLSILTFVAAIWNAPWMVILPILGLLGIAAVDTWTGKTDNPTIAYRCAVTLAMLGAVLACWSSHWAFWSIVSVAIMVALNTGFYGLMYRLRGPSFAILCIPLHWLHYLSCGIAFGLGIGFHFRDKPKGSSEPFHSADVATTDRASEDGVSEGCNRRSAGYAAIVNGV